jgi:acyl-CoA synthetase (AMP-forming)/AMP-acid ligase II/thioesterase domain-containing protein
VSAHHDTIASLLDASVRVSPGRPAILAPGRAALTYQALGDLVRRTRASLHTAGFGRRARIAVVLSNGPEAATTFLTIASTAACAPLNPAFSRKDIEYYLGDLRADALLVDRNATGPAVEAVAGLGIPVLRIHPRDAAGDFDLVTSSPVGTEPAGHAEPGLGDTALLLHTSGTTSKPKLVVLSSANLCASARHIAATLALGPDDRCLNIMPLFHIHGLVAALLSSLHAGASVVCTDGVYGSGFFDWMREFRPTWYTAVPTMHQAIVSRADANSGVIADVPLRFIRSSSASLPPTVLSALEAAFHAPVIEAYGMTEASHQMASNPLPPLVRKPGTVGRAAGPEVAIMDGKGTLVGPGEVGEVVIRGPNVTSGYADNPAANADAFVHGWFRTGDQGVLDEDGYLRLIGRLKELINRGGEKISPREVDEALLAHPAVAQAVAFAIPHAQLGEDVGAAVEVRAGTAITSSELRAFAAGRLAPFKVPRTVVIVDTIPKGPTGKLQRIGLAGRLGIAPLDDRATTSEHVAPRTALETRIAEIWSGMFPGEEIGVRTRFESLGGDSLLAVRMLAAVSDAIGRDVPYLVFAEDGTVEALASLLDHAVPSPATSLVALRREGDRPPLYCVPGHDSALHGLDRLARVLPPGQPVWAFDLRRIDRTGSVEALARRCLDDLVTHDQSGAYQLAGICFGGVVVAEIARQAVARGLTVAPIVLVDALNPSWRHEAGAAAVSAARVAQLREKSRFHTTEIRSMSAASAVRYVTRRGAAFVGRSRELLSARVGSRALSSHHLRLASQYRPAPFDARATIVRVTGRRLHAPDLGWTGVFKQGTLSEDVPFALHGALSEESVGPVSGIIARALNLAETV